MKKKLIILGIALLVLVGIGAVVKMRMEDKPKGTAWRTRTIERGLLVQEVRATGSVQPITLVQVGTQVNGQIVKLYVDFNQMVTQGQLIAQIDPSVYEAAVARDEASLASAQANLELNKVNLALAEKTLERITELLAQQMASQADFDSAQTSRDALRATRRQIEASLMQSEASLKTSRANLGYTTISSPVNGIVISRNVDEGATVVSSMNAQTICQIATDLSTIQVQASIAESDIGGISSDQPVTFTVDAYRNTFTGAVMQVRMSATTVQNVVTFPVIVQASNPDLKLFPGMTANLGIETGRDDNALIIPSAALRFTPDNVEIPPPPSSSEVSTGSGGGRDGQGGGGRGQGGGQGGGGGRASSRAGGSGSSRIWIVGADGQPEAVYVRQKLSDGTNVSVEPHDKNVTLEGREVILGVQIGGKTADAQTNPFAPRMPSGAQGRAMR